LNKIAVIMTTIKKDKMLLKCLPSFLNKNLTIYLLDQGKITPEKAELYKALEMQRHHIFTIESDIGLSAARNFLIHHIIEPFFFIVDDDVELKSNPEEILYHFNNPNIAIVGGMLFNVAKNKEHHYEYALEIKNNKLWLKNSKNIDLVLNFFIARKEVWNDIKWDEELKMVEHADYFLRLKQLNKWKVIYDPILFGNHYSYEFRTQEYKSFRRLKFGKYLKLFHRKWNIYGTEREKWIKMQP